MTTLLDHYIEMRATRSGESRPYLAGTRISLTDIYVHHVLRGESADEIVAAFPHLTVSQVYAALAYCFDHLAEIRADLQREAEHVEQLRDQIGPGPLARKRMNDGDSIPRG